MDELNQIISRLSPARRAVIGSALLIITLLLCWGIIIAMGRAWDYECYIHSDEYFETTEEFGDAVRQYRVSRLEEE